METRKRSNWTVKRCSSPAPFVVHNLVFLVTVAVLMSSACAIRQLPVGDDHTPDRPVAGLLNSGYFFPKFLYWRGVRTSPGSFRYAHIILLVCCVDCIFMPKLSGKLKQYFGSMNSLLLVSVVVYSQQTASTLSDLITAFFIGLCATQVQVDIVRQVTLTLNKIPVVPGPTAVDQFFSLPRKQLFSLVWIGSFHVTVPLAGLAAFPFTAVLILTYQDSYHPMEILSFAYCAGSMAIITFMVVICAFNREHTRNPFAPSDVPRPVMAANQEQEFAAIPADRGKLYFTKSHVSWVLDYCPSGYLARYLDLVFSAGRRRNRRATWRFRLLGSIASGAHFFFVVWAFLIARRVDGVHPDVLYKFLFTTGVTSLLISWQEMRLNENR